MLRKQNKELLDRLMATNFEEFKVMSAHEELPEVDFSQKTTMDFTDENWAGTIVTEEEENGQKA